MAVRSKRSCSITMPTDVEGDVLKGFFSELAGLLAERPEEITLDCSLLVHVSSSHVNSLWEAQTICEHAGIRLRLCFVRYGLHRVLRVLDLDEFFLIDADSLETAEEPQELPVRGRAMPVFNVDLTLTLTDISLALERFETFVRGLGIPGQCAFDLQTVFYEIMTNIRRHGGLDKSESVSVTVTPSCEKVTMNFVDAGRPFDPTGPMQKFDPRSAIKRRQRDGIGLSLIRRLVDRIRYQRVDGRLNVVTIEKDLRQDRREHHDQQRENR